MFKNPMTPASLVMSALLSATAPALAQTPAAAAPAPDHTFSVNAGAVTDYRYRGISQSRNGPAGQAGADYSHKSGAYAGLWGSSINWIRDNRSAAAPNVKGSIELDIYGGYKGSITSDITYDVGYLRYQFLGNTLASTGAYKNANTDELYGSMTYGPVTVKYSHALSNLFGNYDFTGGRSTKGSGYLDVTANFDMGSGITLTPHIGRQMVRNLSIASYTDYSLGVSKDFSGFLLSATAIGTNADKSFYFSPYNGKALGKATLVVGAKYTLNF